MTPINPSSQPNIIVEEFKKMVQWASDFLPPPLNGIAKSLASLDSFLSRDSNLKKDSSCTLGQGALFRCRFKNSSTSVEILVPEKPSVKLGPGQNPPHLEQGVVTFFRISGHWE